MCAMGGGLKCPCTESEDHSGAGGKANEVGEVGREGGTAVPGVSLTITPRPVVWAEGHLCSRLPRGLCEPPLRPCAKTAGRWWVQLTCLADWPSFILDEDNLQCFRVWTLPTPLFGFAFVFLAWWNKTLLKQWRPSSCNLPHDLSALIESFRFLSKSSLLSGKKQSWYLYRPRTSWWEKA